MKRLSGRRLTLLLAVPAALVLLGFAMAGGVEFGIWHRIGLATGVRDDARPVDVPTLERRSTPNDALICPAEFCPRARADAEPAVFTTPAAGLREKLRRAALAEPRTVELDTGDEANRLRFVQRSLLLRYPDVVDVLIVPRSSGAATLAIYSRSLVGRSDFGVNRARVERWLEALSR